MEDWDSAAREAVDAIAGPEAPLEELMQAVLYVVPHMAAVEQQALLETLERHERYLARFEHPAGGEGRPGPECAPAGRAPPAAAMNRHMRRAAVAVERKVSPRGPLEAGRG